MEFNLETSEGMILTGDFYGPDSKPSGILILIHGLGDHFRRYSDWASRFTEKDIAVVGIDLPGHGRSPGRRGHIKNYQVYNSIIESLAKFSRETFGELPTGLYGHSLGGNIVLNYLLTNTYGFDFAIATSSWLKLVSPPSGTTLALARVLSKITPGLLQPNGLQLEDISRAEDVTEKYKSDPFVHDRISLRLGIEATEAAKRILETGDRIDIPVLLLHGEDDKISSTGGSSRLADINNNISLKIWENGYHELQNEPFNDEVFNYIYTWLNKLLQIEIQN